MTASLRDVLFGDLGMGEWPGVGVGEGEPWETFVVAREAVGVGRVEEAVAGWRRVIGMKGLETRHYLQAWHFLRGQGVAAPSVGEGGREVLGVALEVPMAEGFDLLAAYKDGTARYYNYSGSAVVWDRPDGRLDGEVGALLAAGEGVMKVIGLWDKGRPGVPGKGRARLNFLTRSGLAFGEGPMGVMAGNGLGKGVINAGVVLMGKMIEIGK